MYQQPNEKIKRIWTTLLGDHSQLTCSLDIISDIPTNALVFHHHHFFSFFFPRVLYERHQQTKTMSCRWPTVCDNQGPVGTCHNPEKKLSVRVIPAVVHSDDQFLLTQRLPLLAKHCEVSFHITGLNHITSNWKMLSIANNASLILHDFCFFDVCQNKRIRSRSVDQCSISSTGCCCWCQNYLTSWWEIQEVFWADTERVIVIGENLIKKKVAMHPSCSSESYFQGYPFFRTITSPYIHASDEKKVLDNPPEATLAKREKKKCNG